MEKQFFMSPINYILVLGFASSGALVAAPQNNVYDETKSVVVKWAETRDLASREWSQWQKEEAILVDLARMLEAEKKDLESKIEAAREAATESDKRRAEIVQQRQELEEASAVVRSSIEGLESRVREIAPYFPDSYRESVAPLLGQLPDAGQASRLSLSVRLRNVIAILSQANKFDSTLSVETGTRSFEDGRSKQVDTIYLGMAIAYYADASGEEAGYGYPTSEGWKWEAVAESGKAIRDAIAMYRKGKQAEFVALPIVIN